MNQEALLELASANVQKASDSRIEQIRKQLPVGESAMYCIECDAEIPERRRVSLPGVQLCVSCQEVTERGTHR